MPPRLTVTTARSKAARLWTDLVDWLSAFGEIRSTRALLAQTQQVQALLEEEVWDVEVLVGHFIEPATGTALRAWLGVEPQENTVIKDSGAVYRVSGGVAVSLSMRIFQGPVAKRPGGLVPGVLVWAVPPREVEAQLLHEVARGRVLVYVLRHEQIPSAQSDSRCAPLRWRHLNIGSDCGASGLLTDLREMQGVQVVVRSRAAAAAVLSCVDAAQVAVAGELRRLSVKKMIAGQRLAISRSWRSPVSSQDLSTLRARLQASLDAFERRTSDSQAELLTPSTGSLWTELEPMLQGVRLTVHSESGRRVETVEQQYQAELLQRVKTSVSAEWGAQMDDLHGVLQQYTEEVDAMLALHAEQRFNLGLRQVDEFSEARRRRIFSQRLEIARPYQAEISARGLIEYTIVLRKIPLPGLLLPLAVAAVAGFMTGLNGLVRGAVVTLTVLAGLLLLHRAVVRERKARDVRAADRASDSVKGELRRILQEVQRDWGETVRNLSDIVIADAAERLERIIRETTHVQSSAAETARKLSERHLQALESLEKHLTMTLKNGQSLSKEAEQLLADTVPLVDGFCLPKGGSR